jgi:hypothetical protein
MTMRRTSVFVAAASRFLAALAAAGIAITFLATGCSVRERICGDGEYPAKAVGNTTGRVCVAHGTEPPHGYVRYPEGKAPTYVDDEWDKYWRTVIVDEKGNVVQS